MCDSLLCSHNVCDVCRPKMVKLPPRRAAVNSNEITNNFDFFLHRHKELSESVENIIEIK